MTNTFIKYIIGGGVSYVIKVGLTYLSVTFFDFWYFYAYLVSLVIVVFVNFVINSYFIFRVNGFNVKRIVKYLLLIVVFNSLDVGLVVLLTDNLLLHYLISITISTIFVFLLKFFVYRYFVFSPDKTSDLSKDNYNTFSSKTSVSEYNKVYLKQIESRVVEKYFNKGIKVLDLGCGAGRTTRVLKDQGYNVMGVDISPQLIESAKAHHPDIDFRVGDASDLDFSDNEFDLVFFSFNGLDYLFPKAQRLQAIDSIKRVLKNNGLFVYSSHNALNIPRTKMSLQTFVRAIITLKILSHYRVEKHDMGNLTTYYGSIFSEISDLKKTGFVFVDALAVGGSSQEKNKLTLSLLSKHIMYVFKKK
jgi:ubiquinone/menaquinone biosynthesis C-methylase UbiE/putative flippase GtrA